MITVSNTGTTDLNHVKITVKDASGNVLYEGPFVDKLAAGMQSEQEILISVPADFTTSDITASVTSDETFEQQLTMKQTIETVTSDLAVTAKNKDLITVTNNGGNEAENVSFVVKDGGENGNVIHTETLETLSSEQSKDISLVEIWNKATRNDISGTKILYLEVEQEETEYELWNNSIVLEKEVAPTATPTPTVLPTQTPTVTPTVVPTKQPMETPTVKPTTPPTLKPTTTPTVTPTVASTEIPSNTGYLSDNKQIATSVPQNVTNENTSVMEGAKVPRVKFSKLKVSGKCKVKATWKKLTNISGYQIQYAPNKKFKKAKSKTVKSTSVTIKKLKKKKTYFVRVRAYKLVDGKKVYGKWSVVKKVKIKK